MQKLIVGSLFTLAVLNQASAIPAGVENAADLPESMHITCAAGECSEEDLAALNAAADLLIPGNDEEFGDWSISSSIKPSNKDDDDDEGDDEYHTQARRDVEMNDDEITAKVGEVQHCAQGGCSEEERKALEEELRSTGIWDDILRNFDFEYGLDYKIGRPKDEPTAAAQDPEAANAHPTSTSKKVTRIISTWSEATGAPEA